MRRSVADDHARPDRLREFGADIGHPRELRQRELDRGVDALGRIAAAVRGERPEVLPRLGEARGEVPRLRLPLVGPVAVADDPDAHALRDAPEEGEEVVDPALRVGDLARHAGGRVDEDREIHRPLGDGGEILLERDEPLGRQRRHPVEGDLPLARGSRGHDRGGAVSGVLLRLAVPLAPPVVPARIGARGDRREPRRERAALGPVHAEDDPREERVAALAEALRIRGVGGFRERREHLERDHRLEEIGGILDAAEARVDGSGGNGVASADDRA